MRLGGSTFEDIGEPDLWVGSLARNGFRAAFWPGDAGWPADRNRAYGEAAGRADIVIAEVGAWSNPLSADDKERRQALDHCRRQLALADEVGALCCVNIAGSRGAKWDGPHPDNLSEETFDRIVETVRAIIDAVRPKRASYALETMPWVFPDSPHSYARLIDAIDRERFAVHLDPVNLVNCPRRFYRNADLIRECFAVLGRHIVSCHAKDINLREELTVHLEEVRPGLGALDYRVFLSELARLGPDIPIMLEHLSSAEEYRQAAVYLRAVGHEIGVEI